MSEDRNRDDANTILQYMTLKTSLLTNLSMLRQELWNLWLREKNRPMKKEAFDYHLNNIADRRDSLISIARQVLSSADLAQFNDLVEKSLVLKYEKFNLRKLKMEEKKF